MKLGIIIGATREGRQTPRQAKWILNSVSQFEDVQAEIIDLIDYPLPFFNEAISPRYNPNRTTTPEVQKFLDKMAEQDAYVFVTPEYNHSIPAVLKNAFDYLTWEMVKKPAAVASHGSVGGARAAMQLKEILSEGQAVVIPKFSAVVHMSNLIDEEGTLDEEASNQPYGPQAQLNAMLEELVWYGEALKAGRENTVSIGAQDEAKA